MMWILVPLRSKAQYKSHRGAWQVSGRWRWISSDLVTNREEIREELRGRNGLSAPVPRNTGELDRICSSAAADSVFDKVVLHTDSSPAARRLPASSAGQDQNLTSLLGSLIGQRTCCRHSLLGSRMHQLPALRMPGSRTAGSCQEKTQWYPFRQMRGSFGSVSCKSTGPSGCPGKGLEFVAMAVVEELDSVIGGPALPPPC